VSMCVTRGSAGGGSRRDLRGTRGPDHA
jgi:hypothetical protein